MRNARLLHYSHCVSDIERSRKFYTGVLGFETVGEFDFDDEATARVMGVPGARFKGIFMKCDGMRIELIGFSNPPPTERPRRRASNEVGHSHLSFYVTDLDATLTELASKGVPVDRETRASLAGGIECCVVRDPDGFPIEIVQMPTLDLLPYEMPTEARHG
jgi:catechol 2,3-dioxygenase-like lactoylglutathione lyase family enzyme